MYDVTLSFKIGRGGPFVRVDPVIIQIFNAWTVLDEKDLSLKAPP